MIGTVRTTLFLLAVTACSSQPGDPNTFVLDGETVAGYAWSGPYSEYVLDNGSYVGWQVRFTNTDYCPASVSDLDGAEALDIVTPERVYPPSTQLPTLPSLVVPVVWQGTFDMAVNETGAVILGNRFESLSGTLTLSTFNEDEVAGTFDASVLVMALGSSDEMREAHGTFVAPRCARIHDY